MPKLSIDNREVEVPPGATVLDAARKLDIDIPVLCFREGCSPSTSCLVCLVRIGGDDRLAPSCATAAAEGMRVESETESVHHARRTALELLLSDHLGDCVAPCQFGCPAQMDIPTMLRQIAAGQLREAIATVKRDIALPAVLGRICPGPCEKVCRRAAVSGPLSLRERARVRALDGAAFSGDSASPPSPPALLPKGEGRQDPVPLPTNLRSVPGEGRSQAVSICLLKRLAADADLVAYDPYLPLCKPATGKRVAIVGAGPTGLSAAYYLQQAGHVCTVFDEHPLPGGRLLNETTESELPRDVLQAEVATITRLGITVKAGVRIGSDANLADLRARFDAVLLACGATAIKQAGGWGLSVGQRGIEVKPHTYETSAPAVFAAGNAIRGKALVIRSAADGKEAAVAIDQFLRGQPVTGCGEPFSTKIGRMESEELTRFAADATDAPRREPASSVTAGFTPLEGTEQAARCLHCDCRGLRSCKLRKYAAIYNAQPRRYKAERRVFYQDVQHAEVIYEPGKCIDCGLCIQIAATAGEPLGLTFVGRGFDVRVAVPLDRSLAEALTKVAAECVAACPTAALAWKHES